MKLKTKLSKLRHDGHITDAEYSIIINALNRKPKERVQQPCENCILRSDVLALAEKGVLVSNDNYQAVCKAINELPSVMPKGETITEFADRCRECGAKYGKLLKQEQKTGHWILGVCDECEYDWGKDAPIASVPNFCPNCGCRMIKPQESESDD